MGEREGSFSNVVDPSASARPQWSCPDGIMVCARTRPLTSAERADPNVQSAVECLQDELIVNVGMGEKRGGYSSAVKSAPKLMRYPFHRVFHQSSSQEEVFHHACAGIVHGAMEGINGAVMAYGATGSGKTHSMFGGEFSTLGIIFQASQLLMQERDRLLRDNPEKSIRFQCSFVEVYQEEVYDLLHPLQGRSKLVVQDVGSDHAALQNNAEPFVLKGLSYVCPTEFREFVEFVQRGLHNRAIACTKGNAQSSRSHAIVTIEVEVKHREDSSKGTLSRLRFCDLAGCERAALQNTLKAQQEGAKINQSLLELGCVTQALVRRSKERAAVVAAAAAGKKHVATKVFVSWRGSKLTRLMRDCLEGNCRTAMLICVSPTSVATDDTRRAMEFAMKAKEVQLSAKPNEYTVNTPEVAKEQARLIERLRLCLMNMGVFCKSHGINPTEAAPTETDRDFLALELGLHTAAVTQQGETPLLPALSPGPVVQLSHAQQLHLSPIRGEGDVLAELQQAAASLPPYSPVGTLHTVAQSSLGMPGVTSPLGAATAALASARNQVVDHTKYEKLMERIMKIVSDKSDIYRVIKETAIFKERLSSQIRSLSVQLAEHMARDPGNEPPPLSIVNADRELRNCRVEVESLKAKLNALECSLDVAEAGFSTVRNQLQIDGSDFVTELILQRANAAESGSSLELLSAQYLQEKMSQEMLIEEYKATQDRLKATVHDLMKFCPVGAPERRHADVALSFADMTREKSATAMLDVFRMKLSARGYSYANTTKEGSSFHIAGSTQGPSRTPTTTATTTSKRRGGSGTPPAVSLQDEPSNASFTKTTSSINLGAQAAANNSAHKVRGNGANSNGGGGGAATAGNNNTTPGANNSSSGSAFGRSATAFTSLSGTSLSSSPAMLQALRREKHSGSNRLSFMMGASVSANGGADNTASAPPKKPLVPFTSAAAAAAASSLAVKTPSGGNTLLGQGTPEPRR